MKFTLSWLKDHLDTNKDLDTIVDTLTNIGLEIESVEDKSKDYNDFTVAEVLKAEKHPDADKLKVQRNKELNNGRLAMISIMSFCAAANIPGSVPALEGNPMF